MKIVILTHRVDFSLDELETNFAYNLFFGAVGPYNKKGAALGEGYPCLQPGYGPVSAVYVSIPQVDDRAYFGFKNTRT